MTAQVTLNGDVVAFDDPATVADAVSRALGTTGTATDRRGIAVALNQEVIPQPVWAATPLRSGDRVEIITAVQGG